MDHRSTFSDIITLIFNITIDIERWTLDNKKKPNQQSLYSFKLRSFYENESKSQHMLNCMQKKNIYWLSVYNVLI